MAAVLACALDSLGRQGGLRLTSLLLSRRVLQGVLGRPAGLRCRRAAQDVSGGTFVSRSSCRTFTATFFTWPLLCLAHPCWRHDVWKALWFVDPATGKTSFGLGIGTLVLALNVYLLGAFTFGCHALRHLIGGFRDELSKSPACYQAYRCVSCFNRRHMLFAWLSLFWVGFTDLYIRLCSTGVWHDLRLF